MDSLCVHIKSIIKNDKLIPEVEKLSSFKKYLAEHRNT